MRILIVLLVAALFTVGGGFIGGSLTDTTTGRAPTGVNPSQTQEEAMRDAVRAMGQGADVMRRRQTNVMIGGGIGVVAGVAAGVLLASRLRPAKPAP